MTNKNYLRGLKYVCLQPMSAKAEAEKEQYRQTYADLLVKLDGLVPGELVSYTSWTGHNIYSFSGEYTEKLTEIFGHAPTAEELVMYMCNGLEHHGALCSIYKNTFSINVYHTADECFLSILAAHSKGVKNHV